MTWEQEGRIRIRDEPGQQGRARTIGRLGRRGKRREEEGWKDCGTGRHRRGLVMKQ
jgi:hypothetical protein